MRATVIASWAGRFVAVAVFALPIYFAWQAGTSLDIGSLVFSLMVAAYLFQGASTNLTRAKLSSRVPSLNAHMFIKSIIRVEGSVPLAQSLRQRDEARAAAIVVIDGYGHPVGIVQEQAVAAVPPERRPWVPTSSVAVSVSADQGLPADLAGERFIQVLAHSDSSEHLILDDDGAVIGVLSTGDVEKALAQS